VASFGVFTYRFFLLFVFSFFFSFFFSFRSFYGQKNFAAQQVLESPSFLDHEAVVKIGCLYTSLPV
jgi:hypothetical protein